MIGINNVWAELSELKKDFPLGSKVLIKEEVEDDHWGLEIGGKLAEVVGYDIYEGMIELITETGLPISLYCDEIELYFESQVC